jgi:hypothetical protein
MNAIPQGGANSDTMAPRSSHVRVFVSTASLCDKGVGGVGVVVLSLSNPAPSCVGQVIVGEVFLSETED